MIADLITFATAHPFVAGLIVGGLGLGIPLAFVGWWDGYRHAMLTVTGWMRPKTDEAHGDVPDLPPVRERRFIPTTGRGS